MPLFTTRELLAQCIMPRVSADEYYADENVRATLHTLIREYGIGGVCVFAGEAVATAQMIQELQSLAARNFRQPLLVSADFEHGVAMRLYGGTSFPHAMALGVADDTTMTERVARAIALETSALGIHWNFAPVADINSNKNNPIINIRSFGEVPATVSRHASAYIRGTQSANILACAKHFPGHGDTQTDSHLALPTLHFDRERLLAVEVEPFRAAIASGVRSVMVGHLAVPSLDASALPASLSRIMMTGLLREELGFTGIIVTDALDMKAIISNFSVEESAVKAFAAGADVLLLPPDPIRALLALEKAVESGTISQEKVWTSAKRVLESKQWCGLVNLPEDWSLETLSREQIERVRRKPEDIPAISKQDQSLLALEAIKPALRWFGAREKLQSLMKFQQIAGFAFVAEKDIPAATNFFRYLGQNYSKDCDFVFVDSEVHDDDITELINGTKNAEAIVFAVFVRAEAESGSVRLPERFVQIIPDLTQGKPSVAVLFGNPYVHETFPADAFLCTFSSSEAAFGAAAFELVQSSTVNN